MFRCDGAKGDEYGRIGGTRIIKESPEDLLDIFLVSFPNTGSFDSASVNCFLAS